MGNSHIGNFLKLVVFLTLIVLFYFGYFKSAFKLYSKKLTNTLIFEESIKETEPPTVTVCFSPPYKPSVMTKYKINGSIFWRDNFPSVLINNTIQVLYRHLGLNWHSSEN